MVALARRHLVACLPLYALLAAYFLTTVLGNLLYMTPLGQDLPALSITHLPAEFFDAGSDASFWLLLLIPFAAVPLISLAARALLRPVLREVAPAGADMPPALYAVLLISLYAVVIYQLQHAGAWTRLTTARDAIDVVQQRFEIIALLGTKPRIALLSLLVFLSIYSCVKAERRGGWWRLIAAGNAVVMIALLTLLSMKWPVVLFILTMGAAAFVVSERWAIAKTGAYIAAGVVVYLMVSVSLLKMIPASGETGITGRAAGAAFDQSGRLLAVAVNRMAVSVPYYWSAFRDHHCGKLFDSVQPSTSCSPSHVIYATMFPKDGFEGRGTAPAAFHIYEFARAGWSGVVIALAVGGFIIGCFMALWPAAKRNDLLAAAFVMGSPTGYLLSQLPCEGVLFYDHGIVYWVAPVVLLCFVDYLRRRQWLRAEAQERTP